MTERPIAGRPLRYCEYATGTEPMQWGDARIDEKQPDSMFRDFHFGLQSAATKNKDAGTRRIGIVGAGDVYTKFVKWVIEHRGSECVIFDPKHAPGKDGNVEYVASKEELAARNIDCLMVLTTPALHTDYMAWAQQQKISVMMEKPLVVGSAEIDRFEAMLTAPAAPSYMMDWETALATPMMKALGLHAPFADAVEVTKGDFGAFDINNVVKIRGAFVEGGDNALGDVDKVKRDRPWLFDYTKGGGATYDLSVHPMNALAVMGFLPGAIEKVTLAAPGANLPKGVYKTVAPTEGELYSHVTMKSIRAGKQIDTVIETGKGGQANDMGIELTDGNGMRMAWCFGHEKSEVTLYDRAGTEMAKAEMKIDPYAMMTEQALRFFDEQKAAGRADALYLPEYASVIRAIDRIHTLGRQGQGGEIVKQEAYKTATERAPERSPVIAR